MKPQFPAEKGTSSGAKHELLFSQFGVNYNDVDERFRKGSVIVREVEMVLSSIDSSVEEVLMSYCPGATGSCSYLAQSIRYPTDTQG
jgi:tRNA(His) 5'-end guanylyltransferase